MSGVALSSIYYGRGWWDEVDWVPVVTIIAGDSSSWSEFHSFYSPSERLYYYASGSGCSCSSFAFYFREKGDWWKTPREEELRNAILGYIDVAYRWSETEGANQRIAAIASLRDFKKGGAV